MANRRSVGIVWADITCPVCRSTFDYTAGVRAWAGSEYPAGVRVVTCSRQCAIDYDNDHRTVAVPDYDGTLFAVGGV